MFVNKIDWPRALIYSDATVELAILNLELTALRVVLVIDKQDRFIGIVTDGDIRRGFINGLGLQNSISQVMNSKPVTVDGKASTQTIYNLMEEHKIQHVPVLDETMKVKGLFVLERRSRSNSRMNRVVIMAGGKGIRMRPLTENTPKPMVLIAGKPILEHVLERLKQQGFSVVTICTSYLGNVIRDYFGDGSKWGLDIEYLDEKSPLGTAGSIRNLQKVGDLPLVVVNGDIISEINLGDMVDFHVEQRAVATMAIRPHEIQNQFGVVETNGIEISAIIEKPIYRTHVSTGIYVLEPYVVDLLPKADVIQMPELFDHLRTLGCRTLAFHIQDNWFDLAEEDDIARTEVIMLRRKHGRP
jgi:dTDP-glucose pyrophosphorylase